MDNRDAAEERADSSSTFRMSLFWFAWQAHLPALLIFPPGVTIISYFFWFTNVDTFFPPPFHDHNLSTLKSPKASKWCSIRTTMQDHHVHFLACTWCRRELLAPRPPQWVRDGHRNGEYKEKEIQMSDVLERIPLSIEHGGHKSPSRGWQTEESNEWMNDSSDLSCDPVERFGP